MSPRPRSRQDQKATTRAQLVRAGRRVFAKRGYDATTVADLCRAARVTHGALYHHFPSKLELFVAVAEQLGHEVAARVQQAADAHGGWQQVEAACAAYLSACAEPDVATIFLRDAPRVIPATAFSELDRAANEPMVTGLLQRWVDMGLMRPFPIELVARMLGAAFAEGGAAIAASPTRAETQATVAEVLRAWMGTLRA